MKTSLPLEDFLFRKKESVLEKLNFFIKSGKNKLHLLLDFDRTLTKSWNKAGENVSVWEVLRSHLPKKSQEEYQRFYNKYRVLEMENRLKLSDTITWWERILGLFQENKLNWSDIKKDIDLRMPIRPFIKELFEVCEDNNIPTIIISAGIKDIIELWCQKFKIKPTVILSTKLIFSPEGFMTGWNKDSLIHVLNKREKGHKEIHKIKSNRPNTILIGDSLDDIFMVEGEKTVLRIAVYDPRGDDKVNNLEEFTKKFDLVIKNGTLQGVVKILNLF